MSLFWGVWWFGEGLAADTADIGGMTAALGDKNGPDSRQTASYGALLCLSISHATRRGTFNREASEKSDQRCRQQQPEGL